MAIGTNAKIWIGWLAVVGGFGAWTITKADHQNQQQPVPRPIYVPMASLTTSYEQRPVYPAYPTYSYPSYVAPLPTFFAGTICGDGSVSGSTGRGTCSHHGGIRH